MQMLEGNLVFLRAPEDSDSLHYKNWINDNETNSCRGLYYPTSSKEANLYIAELSEKTQDSFSFTITDKNHNPIGFIGIRNICMRSRRGELWIYIGNKDYWNKGYGQDSLKTLINFSFSEVNLHRIWLECDSSYTAAIKCYENVGFKFEGLLKDGYFRHGQYRNTTIMAILSGS